MNIPQFTFTQYSYQSEQHLNCTKFVNLTVLHGVCYSLVPLCINYKAMEHQYQKEVDQIPEHYLPAIIPKFNKSGVNSQPHGRYKRFVSILAGILFDGVNSFVNHKKQSTFQKGMKKLLARQRVTEGKITAIGTQMVSIAQISLKEIERLQTDIVENNKRLDMLIKHVIHM